MKLFQSNNVVFVANSYEEWVTLFGEWSDIVDEEAMEFPVQAYEGDTPVSILFYPWHWEQERWYIKGAIVEKIAESQEAHAEWGTMNRPGLKVTAPARAWIEKAGKAGYFYEANHELSLE